MFFFFTEEDQEKVLNLFMLQVYIFIIISSFCFLQIYCKKKIEQLRQTRASCFE